VKCPNCHNELVNVYKVGWCHPAYSKDCYDGLVLATKKADDGTELFWFEVNDIEGRALFLKRMKEIEGLEPKSAEIVRNEPIQEVKEVNNQIVISTDKVLKLDKKQRKKEFLKVCLPYY